MSALGHLHRAFIPPTLLLSFLKYISYYTEKQKEKHTIALYWPTQMSKDSKPYFKDLYGDITF